jgi:cystathionine beta-synthase
VVIGADDGVGRAIEIFQSFGISQLPVAATSAAGDISEIVGSIRERSLLDRLFRDPSAVEREVAEVMDPPLPVLESSAGVEAMFADLSRGAEAVVVVDGTALKGVLTRADLLDFLAHQTAS